MFNEPDGESIDWIMEQKDHLEGRNKNLQIRLNEFISVSNILSMITFKQIAEDEH
jgi:hypothetical protein